MKKINEVELASLVAHNAMVDELVGSDKYPLEEDIWVFDEENDVDVYPEDVQDVFNRWYDYFLTMIDDCSESEEEIK